MGAGTANHTLRTRRAMDAAAIQEAVAATGRLDHLGLVDLTAVMRQTDAAIR